jgi:hypothetical protein
VKKKEYSSLNDMLGVPRDIIDDYLDGLSEKEIKNKRNKMNRSILSCMNLNYNIIKYDQKKLNIEEVDKAAKKKILSSLTKLILDFETNKEIAENYSIDNAEAIYDKILDLFSELHSNWNIIPSLFSKSILKNKYQGNK